MSQRHWLFVPESLEGGTGLSVGALPFIVMEKLTVSKASSGGSVCGRLGTRSMDRIFGEGVGDGTIEVASAVSCCTDPDMAAVVSGCVSRSGTTGLVALCQRTCSSVRTRGSLRGRVASYLTTPGPRR